MAPEWPNASRPPPGWTSANPGWGSFPGRARPSPRRHRGLREGVAAVASCARLSARSDERLAFFGRATHEAVWDWDFTTALVERRPAHPVGHPINADIWRGRMAAADHPSRRSGVDVRRTLDDCLRQELWSGRIRLRAATAPSPTSTPAATSRGVEGRPRRGPGPMLDITARKESERGPRDSEERLHRARRLRIFRTWTWA